MRDGPGTHCRSTGLGRGIEDLLPPLPGVGRIEQNPGDAPDPKELRRGEISAPIATEQADVLQAELELRAELGQFATTLEGVDAAPRVRHMRLAPPPRLLRKARPGPCRDTVEPEARQSRITELVVGNQPCGQRVPLGAEGIVPSPEVNTRDGPAGILHDRVWVGDE